MDSKTSAYKKKKGIGGKLLGLAFVAGAGGVLYAYVGPHVSWYLKTGKLDRAPASLRRSVDKIRDAVSDARELQTRFDQRDRSRRRGPDGQGDEDFLARIFDAYGGAVASAHRKMEALRAHEFENERLRLENANLRLWAENLQLDCRVREGSKQTRTAESRILDETGTRTGRTLASIHYRPPAHLLPGQLHTLGVSYLKAREDEKAAVILTFLAELEDNDTYKNPRDHLLVGVAWYRLKNLKLADEYFARALKAKPSAETLPYQAQARLWRGILAEATGKHQKSQYWLRELVDFHPYSTESRWVNNGRGIGPGRSAPGNEADEDELARRALAAESEHDASSDHAPPKEGNHGHPLH